MTANAGDEGRPKIDTSVPHSARNWNYWLGGKDHYPVHRLAGEQTIAVLPEIVDIARASRQFLVRVVRYLAADPGWCHVHGGDQNRTTSATPGTWTSTVPSAASEPTG